MSVKTHTHYKTTTKIQCQWWQPIRLPNTHNQHKILLCARGVSSSKRTSTPGYSLRCRLQAAWNKCSEIEYRPRNGYDYLALSVLYYQNQFTIVPGILRNHNWKHYNLQHKKYDNIIQTIYLLRTHNYYLQPITAIETNYSAITEVKRKPIGHLKIIPSYQQIIYDENQPLPGLINQCLPLIVSTKFD